ncbi:metallophosphoesterase family protein [Nocardioides sp. GXZ039]|uniref:metallophosphoesterase family protein n=1 Tax=Nocardioides sp. GXZ039 TaxID=3136018 RepID=UPI0030F43283
MVREQIALVSDVHGNLTALEAVLADIEDRGITRIFNLGDYVGKGPRGRAVIERCRELCEINLLGNWDDFLPDPARTYDDEALRWWLAELGPDQGEWLRGLPFCHDLLVSGRRVRLMHASAETVHRRVRYVKSEGEFLGQFANTDATRAAVGDDAPEPDVVGYADTHDPFYETQFRGRTLFNTGSAGNAMGDPTASYVILDGVLDEPEPAPFALTFVRVPYDVEAELAAARDLGLPQFDGYAAELRHGLYRGAVEEFEAGEFTLDSYYHAST